MLQKCIFYYIKFFLFKGIYLYLIKMDLCSWYFDIFIIIIQKIYLYLIEIFLC